jgi:hypothetical protein
MGTLCSNRKGEFKSLYGLALDILVVAVAQGRKHPAERQRQMATVGFPGPVADSMQTWL